MVEDFLDRAAEVRVVVEIAHDLAVAELAGGKAVARRAEALGLAMKLVFAPGGGDQEMAIGLADARNLTQSGHDVGDTILVVNGVDRKDKVKGTVGEGQGAVVPGGDLNCHPQIRRALGRRSEENNSTRLNSSH